MPKPIAVMVVNLYNPEDVSTLRFRIFAKIVDWLTIILRLKNFVTNQVHLENLIANQNEAEEPEGLSLSFDETMMLESKLIDLYGWLYDSTTEAPIPSDSFKFEMLMQICNIIKLDPDPHKNERIWRKKGKPT